MQDHKKLGSISNGRMFLNRELLPRLISRLPYEGARVLFVGVHKYWDYSALFDNPGQLCEFETIDTHPGGGDQPAPTHNTSIESCDSLPSDYYDMIVMIGVYEDLKHKQEAFNQIYRMLKPKGIAEISVPGSGYLSEEDRFMEPWQVWDKCKPLRVTEVYVTYERDDQPPSAVHIVATKV